MKSQKYLKNISLKTNIRKSSHLRHVALIVGYLAILSLSITIFLVPLISDSFIDIGLDLTTKPTVTPSVSWGSDKSKQTQMELISDRFSPGRQIFEIQFNGEKSVDSNGNTVTIVDCPYFEKFHQVPENSWHKISPTSFQTSGTQRSVLLYSSLDAIPFIKFQKNNSSGYVTVRTSEESRWIKLYSKTPDFENLNLPFNGKDGRYRYHAFVNRRALDSLCIAGPGLNPDSVRRIYIGALKPIVFSSDNHFSPYTWCTRIVGKFSLDGKTPLPLPRYTTLEQGGFICFCSVFGLSLTILIFIGYGLILSWRLSKWLCLTLPFLRRLAPFDIKQYLLFFFPLLFMWLFFWACFYPGCMSPDSTDQWDQIHTMNIQDAHPAFHTLTLKVLTLLWDSPAVVSLTQVILMSLCMAYAFSLLRRAGVARLPVFIAFLCVLVSPRNGCMVITLWKDILFTIVVALFTMLICYQLLNSARPRRLLDWALLGLLLGIMPLYRHNGLAILAGMIVMLPLFFCHSWRHVLICLLLACGLYTGVKKVVYPYFKVLPLMNIEHWYYATRITGLFYADAPMSEEEYKFLDNLRTLESKWPYNPLTTEVVFGPLFNNGFGRTNFQILHDMDHVFWLRYPLIYTRQYFRAMAYIWLPPQPGNDKMSPFCAGISSNQYNIKLTPLLPRISEQLQQQLWSSNNRSLNWLIWRPAIHVYLMILAIVIMLWRTRNPRFLIIFFPVIGNLLSILLAGLSQDHRYVYPSALLSSFFLCLALIPKKVDDDITDAEPSEPPFN